MKILSWVVILLLSGALFFSQLRLRQPVDQTAIIVRYSELLQTNKTQIELIELQQKIIMLQGEAMEQQGEVIIKQNEILRRKDNSSFL